MDTSTREALARVLAAGIGAAGLGVVGRGAMGLARSLQAPPPETRPQNKIVVPIPVASLGRGRPDFRPDLSGGPAVGFPGGAGLGGMPALPGEKMAEKAYGKEAAAADLPWYLPAVTAAGAVGLYGGYRAADSYLNSREKTQMQDKVDAARQRFRTALVESLAPVPAQPKLALDVLATERGKLAFPSGGKMLGMAGAGATLLALLSGKLMYDAASARSPSALLAKAEKQRQRDMAASRPPAIEIMPTPVSLRGGQIKVLNPEALGNAGLTAAGPGGL